MRPFLDPELVRGRWLHAYEEDEPGQKVFRRATHPLPPARGRTGFEFHPDGRMSALGGGPDDRTFVTEGRWSVDLQGLLTIRPPGGSAEVLHVLEIDDDRLVVKA
jgi:hypothetical protein